jgi:hypothetical protein
MTKLYIIDFHWQSAPYSVYMPVLATGRHKQRAEIPQNVDFYALFTLILRHLASTLAGVVGRLSSHRRACHFRII